MEYNIYLSDTQIAIILKLIESNSNTKDLKDLEETICRQVYLQNRKGDYHAS